MILVDGETPADSFVSPGDVTLVVMFGGGIVEAEPGDGRRRISGVLSGVPLAPRAPLSGG